MPDDPTKNSGTDPDKSGNSQSDASRDGSGSTPQSGGKPWDEEAFRKAVQEEVQRIAGKIRQEERAKYADYDELKKKAVEAESLYQEAMKRLGDTEKAKQEYERRLKALEGDLSKVKVEYEQKISDLEKIRQWKEDFEKRELEALEAEMKDAELTPAQKEIIESLPLERRRVALREFLASTRAPRPGITPQKATSGGGQITLEELAEIKRKYGVFSPQFREAYKRYSGRA